MSQNENDLPDAEEHPTIREVIREWAVPAVAIVIIVIGIGHIINVIRTEIRATEQTLAMENQFNDDDVGQLKDRQYGSQAESEVGEQVEQQVERQVESGSESPTEPEVESRLGTVDGDDKQNAMADAKDEEWLRKSDKHHHRRLETLDRIAAKLEHNRLMMWQAIEIMERIERKLDAAIILHYLKKLR